MLPYFKEIEKFKNNVVIYSYSRNKDRLEFQLKDLRKFCNDNNLNVIEEITDIGKTNSLKDKPNLKNLINNYNNVDIIVTSVENLARRMEDVFYINSKTLENNCRLFIYERNKLLNIGKKEIDLLIKAINEYNLIKKKKKERKKDNDLEI